MTQIFIKMRYQGVETHLLLPLSFIGIAAMTGFAGGNLDEMVWQASNTIFAFLGAIAAHRRFATSRLGRNPTNLIRIKTAAGLLVSSGGGLTRDLAIVHNGGIGNFGSSLSLISVSVGLLLAFIMTVGNRGSGITGEGGNAPSPLMLDTFDIAAGVSFTAAGIATAYSTFMIDGIAPTEILPLVLAGFTTACGGGLITSWLNSALGKADGAPGVRVYGLIMLITSAIFAAIAIIFHGIPTMIHIGMVATVAGLYAAVRLRTCCD